MAKRTAARIAVLPDPKRDPWPLLWQSFERSLRAENASPRTIEIYGDGGRQFYEYSRTRRLPTDPVAIEKAQLEEFLIWLREERNVKPATVRARFSSLRRFFNWLIEEGELEHSPMARIRGVKVDEPAPEVLSEDELTRLLAACRGDGMDDRRDMAILRLMIDTGLRRQEVAAIALDDIDLAQSTITVRRKGGKEGVVYLGAKTTRDIDRYLRARSRHPHSNLSALWLAQKGALTGDGVHHLVTRRARLAGIDRPVWPHLLRHSFAHQLKSQGAADEVVMTLGGWSDSKVMRRYGRSAAQARARDAHRQLSPGDRL